MTAKAKHTAVFKLTVTTKKRGEKIVLSFIDRKAYDDAAYELRRHPGVKAIHKEEFGTTIFHNAAQAITTINLLSL